jgi:hypothetical protein
MEKELKDTLKITIQNHPGPAHPLFVPSVGSSLANQTKSRHFEQLDAELLTHAA